jgi:hypothetical protein
MRHLRMKAPTRRCSAGSVRAASAAVIAAAAALAGACVATAAVRDTPPYMTAAPSKSVTVLVVIDDGGITVHKFRQAGAGAGASLETLAGPVPRGDLLTFNVYNRGKSAHNFTIFGKATPTLKPGRNAHLYFAVKSAGRFLYRSTLDRSKAFQGYLTVQ